MTWTVAALYAGTAIVILAIEWRLGIIGKRYRDDEA